MSKPEIIPGTSDVLLLCDHASNQVPEGIELGVRPEQLDLHIAVDIGAEPLTRALAARLDAPAILATVSRLVIDLHREAEHPDLIPSVSDGHVIPGNAVPDRAARIAAYHDPYHEALAALIDQTRPKLLAAIHSFTPRLESARGDRPWEVGILYNEDDRAARIAIDLLKAEGLEVGDNQPYSGKLLNATLNRHGEGRGLPYLAIEVRNDLIADDAGVARWADILGRVIDATRNRVA
ncbi:MAG: N-formylglutamate amidohydrolase [Sphingomonas sp.]